MNTGNLHFFLLLLIVEMYVYCKCTLGFHNKSNDNNIFKPELIIGVFISGGTLCSEVRGRVYIPAAQLSRQPGA